MREPGCVMMWTARVAKALSTPNQLENINIDCESRVSTRIRSIFRAALAAMDCPFRTMWFQGLPFAMMLAPVDKASLLMRRVLRPRTRSLSQRVCIVFIVKGRGVDRERSRSTHALLYCIAIYDANGQTLEPIIISDVGLLRSVSP